MPGPSFAALFLDFYGTISAGDREAVHEACERIVADLALPVDADHFARLWGESYFRVSEASNHDRFRTLQECETVSLRQALAPFGKEDADPAPYVAVLENYWRNPPLHDDAVDLLARLHLPVCCVSNADEVHLASALARHGLSFHAVVTSEAARCYKPEPGIFQKALRTMNVNAEQVLHVGDSLHSDVGGAKKLGITTVWLRRENRIHDIGTAQADHTIRSLREVAPLISA
jgi:2-haloacid dehalogenase/putative hydrolase of the HAD superfamily